MKPHEEEKKKTHDALQRESRFVFIEIYRNKCDESFVTDSARPLLRSFARGEPPERKKNPKNQNIAALGEPVALRRCHSHTHTPRMCTSQGSWRMRMEWKTKRKGTTAATTTTTTTTTAAAAATKRRDEKVSRDLNPPALFLVVVVVVVVVVSTVSPPFGGRWLRWREIVWLMSAHLDRFAVLSQSDDEIDDSFQAQAELSRDLFFFFFL